MLTVHQKDTILELLKSGQSPVQISLRVGVSIGSVYKYRHIFETEDPKDKNVAASTYKKESKIVDFDDEILALKKSHSSITVIYNELKKKGFTGSYSLLYSYLRQKGEAPDKSYKRSIRVETGPGEQAQVDWGSFGTVEINGRKEKLYAFVYVLSYSRKLYVEFVVRQNQQTFQNCHMNAFENLGIPLKVRYDNVKTVILYREKLNDGSIKMHFTPAFMDFATYYGFEPDMCPPYWPRAKGKVESGVKYVKSSFSENKHFKKNFVSLDQLNKEVTDWLNSIANDRIHRTTKEKPEERWEIEKQSLRFPNTLPRFNPTILLPRRISKDGMVSYKTNSYSVPSFLSRKKIFIKEVAKYGLPYLQIYYQNAFITEHPLSSDHGKWIINDVHLAGKEEYKGETNRKPPLSPSQTSVEVKRRNINYYDVITF
jgi:transposase